MYKSNHNDKLISEISKNQSKYARDFIGEYKSKPQKVGGSFGALAPNMDRGSGRSGGSKKKSLYEDIKDLGPNVRKIASAHSRDYEKPAKMDRELYTGLGYGRRPKPRSSSSSSSNSSFGHSSSSGSSNTSIGYGLSAGKKLVPKEQLHGVIGGGKKIRYCQCDDEDAKHRVKRDSKHNKEIVHDVSHVMSITKPKKPRAARKSKVNNEGKSKREPTAWTKLIQKVMSENTNIKGIKPAIEYIKKNNLYK